MNWMKVVTEVHISAWLSHSVSSVSVGVPFSGLCILWTRLHCLILPLLWGSSCKCNPQSHMEPHFLVFRGPSLDAGVLTSTSRLLFVDKAKKYVRLKRKPIGIHGVVKWIKQEATRLRLCGSAGLDGDPKPKPVSASRSGHGHAEDSPSGSHLAGSCRLSVTSCFASAPSLLKCVPWLLPS